MPKPELKIRTRYQRMRAALLLAESLRAHKDAAVSNVAHEIVTLLGAPGATLNNVIDGFEPSSRQIIAKMLAVEPDQYAHATEVLRALRTVRKDPIR